MLFFSPRQVDSRDYVFPRASSSSSEALQEGRSEELMDKEVRAVFLCLFTYLLGDYQNYVTVIRFKPPSFYFNKVSDVLEEWKSSTVLVHLKFFCWTEIFVQPQLPLQCRNIKF